MHNSGTGQHPATTTHRQPATGVKPGRAAPSRPGAINHHRITTVNNAPAPALAKLQPQPGEVWLNANGERCEIRANSSRSKYPIASWRSRPENLYGNFDGRMAHYADGRSCGSFRECDLVERLEEAPPVNTAPASHGPVTEIPESIRTGAATFYALVVSDDPGSGGNPVICTALMAESTLNDVLQRAESLGTRYGTTYVVECRINPQLTHDAPHR